LKSLGGIATSFLNKAPTSSDNKELISPTAAAGMKKAPFKPLDISKTLVNQANNISFKPGSLSWYKQQGL
jgi:hypothetical protein